MGSQFMSSDDIVRLLVQQLQAPKREFTGVPVLRRETDLELWDARLRLSLADYNLTKYVDEDVPEPADKTSIEWKTWHKDRTDVFKVIFNSIQDTSVFSAMRNMDWDYSKMDPYVTYKKVFEALQKITPETIIEVHNEFHTISRAKFDTCEKFINRMVYLKNKMEARGIKESESSYLLTLISAVRDRSEIDTWPGAACPMISI
ncbi:hypothetical protein QBC46DRAFT_451296 [Diplogelasinospora grovesii]|uniref:Uncharacterized protein n=1 Tax=Diplogelasinospora grovesii TaxID=303347 RepID=A0AAN6N4H8_9PEZI|nr:hypothetical protein QBC46DRAFT_451296 [Diplogelasinospora grovesii]